MEAMPEGTQIRSLALPLAHQLVFPISPIHIAQSLMAAAAVPLLPTTTTPATAVTENRANGCLRPLDSQPAFPAAGLFWSGWMDGSWPPSASASVRPSVHRWSNAIMSCPRRKTASYFQERHELPSSH